MSAAIDVAQSYCWESPYHWAKLGVGWKLRVKFTPIVHRVRPASTKAYGAKPSSIQHLKSARRSGGQGSSHGMLPSASLA